MAKNESFHAARYETRHRLAPFPEENERSFAKTGSGQAKAKLRERRHFLSGVIVEETEAQQQSHAAQELTSSGGSGGDVEPVRTVPIHRIESKLHAGKQTPFESGLVASFLYAA